jgi:Uma2 family endonuclease
MQPQRRPYLTEEEYLAIERRAEYKSEYYQGEMFAMAGASEKHNLITLNIAAELHGIMKNRPCRVYSSDMRVKIQATGLYTYPDVVVVCGELVSDDAHRDTLLNPTLIVEVLSKSTEAYDRGEKFKAYRLVPELREYVLVAQDRPHVEVFTRSDTGMEWVLRDATGVDAQLNLHSIDCTLSLADIYSKVEFDEPTGLHG